MMKSRKYVMIAGTLLLIMGLISGCGKKQSNDSDKKDTTSKENTVIQSQDDDDEDEKDTANEETYQVEMVSYEKTKNHDVSYPKISGLSNASVQKKVNDYLYTDVDDMMKEYYGEADQINQSYEVTYQDEKMLSMVCTGSEYGEGAAHPYAFCKSYTFNMSTGELLTLKDYGDTAKLAAALLHTHDYTVDVDYDLSCEEILDFNFMGLPAESLLVSSLDHFDMDYEEYGEGEAIGYSYLKQDGTICLIFSVSHAAGDYVVVEVPGCATI